MNQDWCDKCAATDGVCRCLPERHWEKLDPSREVLCNLCGLPCTTGFPGGYYDYAAGLIDASASGGFESTPGNGSGTLDDGTSYHFSLCEFCLDWLFSQFKIPVRMTDYLHGGEKIEEPFMPALERVRRDDWRGMKKVFLYEFEKRNKAREMKR